MLYHVDTWPQRVLLFTGRRPGEGEIRLLPQCLSLEPVHLRSSGRKDRIIDM